MKRAVYVVGPPGVGKSTFVRGLLTPYLKLPEVRLRGQLWGVPLVRDGLMFGVELGRHRAAFSGTDALGMAVNPDAVSWVKHAQGAEEMELVIAEGARLANASFFEALRARADTMTVFHLQASQAELDRRCRERGSTQKDSWRKGAATRAERAAYLASHIGAQLVPLPTEQMTPGRMVEHAREVLSLDR